MIETWKITARPRAIVDNERGLYPDSVSLLARRESGDESYSLVLKNNGHYREMFASIIGADAANDMVNTLVANRVASFPGSFTTRQINLLGFRL